VPTLRTHAVHRSSTVSVFDVSCHPSDCSRGPEEWSCTNQIVVPRRGVFEREVRGARVVADSNHVLFFNRDEAYRVAHPSGTGDDCTVFVFDDHLLYGALEAIDPAWNDRAGPPFRFAQALNDEVAFLLHDQLRRAARSAPNPGLVIDEASLLLLGALLDSAYRARGVTPQRARATTTELRREQTRRTVVFLAQHLGKDVALGR
jgi:hypothetical protein